MVNMIEYIKDVSIDIPEAITTTKTSLAADHLFYMWDKSKTKPWPEEQAMAFHHATAQLLFLSTRARCNIQPAMAFLVKSPDEDNWCKVKRYLKGAINMPLILSVDSLTLSWWWVDAAHNVHHNCKGHTGVGMSFGQGMALRYSWKQKIVAKSLTKAELVGVGNTPGWIIWAHYFMEEQGYDMDLLVLYQDNMSAILLETNGKVSSTKQTKHIKVKFLHQGKSWQWEGQDWT